MNVEEIQNFLDKHELPKGKYLKIQFKKRDSIHGVFVKDRDYNDLKSKNFWRIVTLTHFEEYNKSNNMNLAKIFNGSEFAKLSVV
jgi:hypothetical protein